MPNRRPARRPRRRRGAAPKVTVNVNSNKPKPKRRNRKRNTPRSGMSQNGLSESYKNIVHSKIKIEPATTGLLKAIKIDPTLLKPMFRSAKNWQHIKFRALTVSVICSCPSIAAGNFDMAYVMDANDPINAENWRRIDAEGKRRTFKLNQRGTLRMPSTNKWYRTSMGDDPRESSPGYFVLAQKTAHHGGFNQNETYEFQITISADVSFKQRSNEDIVEAGRTSSVLYSQVGTSHLTPHTSGKEPVNGDISLVMPGLPEYEEALIQLKGASTFPITKSQQVTALKSDGSAYTDTDGNDILFSTSTTQSEPISYLYWYPGKDMGDGTRVQPSYDADGKITNTSDLASLRPVTITKDEEGHEIYTETWYTAVTNDYACVPANTQWARIGTSLGERVKSAKIQH